MKDSFLPEPRGKEGAMRPDEPSQVREMYRHGQLDLLERSLSVAQLETTLRSLPHLCKFYKSSTIYNEYPQGRPEASDDRLLSKTFSNFQLTKRKT